MLVKTDSGAVGGSDEGQLVQLGSHWTGHLKKIIPHQSEDAIIHEIVFCPKAPRNGLEKMRGTRRTGKGRPLIHDCDMR